MTTTLTDAARAFTSPGLSAAPCTRSYPVAALHGNPVTAGGRRSALAVTGPPDPAPVLSDDRGRAREPAPPRCQAVLIEGDLARDCFRGGRVRPFTAECECGHPIEGVACVWCLRSPALGCEDCYRLPGKMRHKCPVTIEVEQ